MFFKPFVAIGWFQYLWVPPIFFSTCRDFLRIQMGYKKCESEKWHKNGWPVCRGSCLVEKALPFHSKFSRHQQTGKHLVINSCSAVPWEQKLWETLFQNTARLYLQILFCLLLVLKIAIFQLESYQCHGTCNQILAGHLFYVLPKDGSLS